MGIDPISRASPAPLPADTNGDFSRLYTQDPELGPANARRRKEAMGLGCTSG